MHIENDLDARLLMVHEGHRLEPSLASFMEQELAGIDANLQLGKRLSLLGFYDATRCDDDNSRESFYRHLLWFIDHFPADPVLSNFTFSDDTAEFESVIAQWMMKLESNPTNLDLLANIAKACNLVKKETAESLWKRAIEVEPSSTRWRRELANLYYLRAMSKDNDRSHWASRACTELTIAQEMHQKNPSDPYMVLYLQMLLKDYGDLALKLSLTNIALEFGRRLVELSKTEQRYCLAASIGHELMGKTYHALGMNIEANGELANMTCIFPESPSFDLPAALITEPNSRDSIISYLTQCKKDLERRIADLSKSPARGDSGRLIAILENFERAGRPTESIIENRKSALEENIETVESWIREIEEGRNPTFSSLIDLF